MRALLRRYPQLAVSVSATTRPPRPGEVDGKHYHFLSPEQFSALVGDNGFLEWAQFAGHHYGTPWSSIEKAPDEAAAIVLEIDVQGAAQVRERFADALLIFLTPPSRDVLLDRLHQRGTDEPARISQRMAIAEAELAEAERFDHVVVNETVDEAVAAIGRILGL